MEVSCEWIGCSSRFTDANDLPVHCRKHISDFYPMPGDAYLQQTALRRQCQTEELSASVYLVCLWKDCAFHATCTLELALHVAFHPHHSILKAAGAAHQVKRGLNVCSLSSDTRNVIPDIAAPYQCCWSVCQQEFKEPILFYRHIKEHISATPRVLRPEGEPGCQRYVQCAWSDCSHQCLNRTRLTDHLRSHTGERTIACPVCGGLFTNATKYGDHLTRQGSIDTAYFQCSHCCKRLQSERLLRDHMRQHVNSLKCELCNMSCPSPAGLKKHMFFKHSSEKPYSCNLCNYRAKTLVDIRRHGESHNVKAAYSCPDRECSFESKSYAQLRRHYNRHHQQPETPCNLYCCQVCRKTYRRGDYLTVHLMKKHFYKHPPSHKRFRYMRGEDGFMYLQLIRFESTTARGGGQHDGEGEFAVGTGEVEGQYASWQGAVDGESDYGDEYGDEMDGDDEDDGEYDLDDFQEGEEYYEEGEEEREEEEEEVDASPYSQGLQSVQGHDESCNDFAEALSVGPSSMLANAGDLEMDVNDDRYASAMAMLQLLSGGQNALAVGDSPSTQQSDDQNGEGIGLLEGLAQLTGQSVADVAKYFSVPSASFDSSAALSPAAAVCSGSQTGAPGEEDTGSMA